MQRARQYLDSLEEQNSDFDLADLAMDDSEISDTLSKSEASSDEGNDYLQKGEELEEAGVELAETQEALEAMMGDPNAPEYAQLALLSRVHCLYDRLGVDLQLASNEDHSGNRFNDPVFVDSLEASLKDTASRVASAIGKSIAKAMQLFSKAWEFLTSTRVRIHRRAKALQMKIQDMSDDDFKSVADKAPVILTKVREAASKAAVTSGSKLVYGKDHAKHCQVLMGRTQKMIDHEKKATESFVEGMQKTADDYKEIKKEGAEDEALESVVSAYLISTVRGGKTPTRGEIEKFEKGGKQPIGEDPMTPGGVGPIADGRGARFEPWPKYEPAVDRASFATWASSKQSVLDTAKFVAEATGENGIASKDTKKAIDKWYSEMRKLAGSAGKKIGKAESGVLQIALGVLTAALLLPVGPITAGIGGTAVANTTVVAFRNIMRLIVKVGFSASMSGLKAWVKSLSSMNVVLGAIAK